MEITLQEMLDAREARAWRQGQLLREQGRPLLCLTMNIAGPVKRTGLIDFAFREAVRSLRERLAGAVVREELKEAATGPEAIWVSGLSAEALKELAVELETERPVGRLYDLDVIGMDGRKLSRGEPRRCLVCGGPVGPCARSRAHGLEAVQAATEKLLREYAAERLGELGVEALIEEDRKSVV